VPSSVSSVAAFRFLGIWKVCISFPRSKLYIELNLRRIAWNTGTCLYMAWAGLACLNQFINSIVWKGNVINWAPVWCDICEFTLIICNNVDPKRHLIAARIIVGTNVAIPAASLCINRRLYYISSVRSVTITKAEKRRAVMVDLAIGLGIPVVFMVLRMLASVLLHLPCYSPLVSQNIFLKDTALIFGKISAASHSPTTPHSPSFWFRFLRSSLVSFPLFMEASFMILCNVCSF